MPHGRDTNLCAHKETSWQTDSETWGGGGGHHRDVGGTEKLANWAVADPGGGFGDAGRLGQNQLLTDWSQGAERRGSNSSWSSSAPSSRSAEPQYPDSFTGKHRARHPVLTDKPAEHPEYVGDGGHSFGANHARARHGSDLQPAVPGGRTGGWRARGGGGGGGGGGGQMPICSKPRLLERSSLNLGTQPDESSLDPRCTRGTSKAAVDKQRRFEEASTSRPCSGECFFFFLLSTSTSHLESQNAKDRVGARISSSRRP